MGGRSLREEVVNAVTHGVGLGLSLVGFSTLVVLACLKGTTWHIVSCSIYGATLVVLYTASTLYHTLRHPVAKKVLQIIDHSSIYLFIAGSYTPFTLVSLRGGWGWTLFGLVWALALTGVVFKTLFIRHYNRLFTLLYLALGWLVIIAVKPLVSMMPGGGILWLAGGGLAYTAGTIFYLWESLPYAHAVWHLFVMLGSLCHYFAIYFYVLPARA